MAKLADGDFAALSKLATLPFLVNRVTAPRLPEFENWMRNLGNQFQQSGPARLQSAVSLDDYLRTASPEERALLGRLSRKDVYLVKYSCRANTEQWLEAILIVRIGGDRPLVMGLGPVQVRN